MQAMMYNSVFDQSTAPPPRLAWGAFPDVLIHAPESAVKGHPSYREAKGGDVLAAQKLIRDNFNQVKASELATFLPGLPPFWSVLMLLSVKA